MSSNHPDNQRPPPRSNTLQLPPGRPPIRSISQVLPRTNQTPTRQVSFDATTFRNLEPTPKRLKIGLSPEEQRQHNDRVYIEIPDDETSAAEGTVDTKEDVHYKLPQFPSRPSAGLRRTASPIHQFNQNREPVPTKPYVLEVPKLAPKYADKKPADFFPWTGNQAEDVLSEQTIKNGYFDKAATPSNESGSARPAIWSHLKHKSGLQLLSHLYVTELQQRQKFGAVSTISTFKPPPRATLTEPKREAWLKDLADSEIPLRRLSRTIPHGIRGKTLLDHCLAKRIPAERSIWLVKCVGANEIRAFKRKGPNALAAGSEAKWVREWTTSMEEFLDALIDSVDFEAWKENLNYGLKIVAYVSEADLIDREHFLTWIATSLGAAPTDKILTWLLITGMFWKMIPEYRVCGHKLAVALCEQAQKLHDQVVEGNQMIWDDLSENIVKLAERQPACFFSPGHWTKYSNILEDILKRQPDILTAIRERNVDAAKFACSSTVADHRQQLVTILDSKDRYLDFKRTSRSCLDLCHDTDTRHNTICSWATTKYRPGHANLYLAVRLLRRWARSESSLEPGIFHFVRSCAERRDLEISKLFKLVSELVRSGHFSIPRYLQWIMAQGSPLDLEKNLLQSIPSLGLALYTQNLCCIVLGSRILVSEKAILIKDQISERLFRDAMVDEYFNFSQLSNLSLPEKYDLAHWLRSQLYERANTGEPLTNIEDFSLITTILERMEDFAILADILTVYVEYGDIALFPVALELVNIHFRCLNAIGAAENLCNTALEGMDEVAERSPAQKPLIISLVDLAQQLQRKPRTLIVLQKELALCEPKSAIAACSPVSDGMGEMQEDSDFFSEVEQLFSGGTIMERPLFTRIFNDIVKRLEASWTDDILISMNLAEFLFRLRSFNREIFSTLMPTWLGTLFTGRKDLKTMLAVLVCRDLINVEEMYTRLVSQAADTKAMSAETLYDLLGLLIDPPQVPRVYHLRAEVESLIESNPKVLAEFLNFVFIKDERKVMLMPGIRELILRLIVHDSGAQALLETSRCSMITTDLVGYEATSDLLENLPRVLNYFNRDLCAYTVKTYVQNDPKLRCIALSGAIVTRFQEVGDCMLEPWKAVIGFLPPDVLLEIHKQIMDLMLDTRDSTGDVAQANEPLLQLLGLVISSLDAQKLVGSIALLQQNIGPVSILQLHLRLLATHSKVLLSPSATVATSTKLHLALNLCSIYLSTTSEPALDVTASIMDVLTILSDSLSSETRELIIESLQNQGVSSPDLLFLFGPSPPNAPDAHLKLVTMPTSAETTAQQVRDNKTIADTASGPCPVVARDILATNTQPFAIHRWEMVQDTTPMIGDNDTSLSLSLFGARKAVL